MLFVSWFLADLDLHKYLSNVPTITPSATALKENMAEEDINTMFVEQEEMKVLSLALMCDKGEGEKSRGEMVLAL